MAAEAITTEAAEQKTPDKKIHLNVLTPFIDIFKDYVDFIIFKTMDGDMGVYSGHEPFTEALDFGSLRIYVNNEQIDLIAVLGGIISMQANEVTIMSDMAHHPDEIQDAIKRRRAEMDVHRQVEEQAAELDVRRSETAIRRALVQMDVSTYAILRENWQNQELLDE